MTIKINVAFILLYSFCILNAAVGKIKDFKCPCGIDRNQYTDDNSYQNDVKRLIGSAVRKKNKSDFRIVGGLEPNYPVAWMAALLIKRKTDFTTRRCGAVLINSKFLLTAAHCLCNNQIPLPCKLKRGAWRPDYDITEIIKANINVRTISTHVRIKETKIKRAFIHKKFLKNTTINAYKESKDGPYDIGMVELMDRINFYQTETRQVYTMPICLPSKTFLDAGINATVAGYGITHSRVIDCITNGKGPDIFTRCSRKHKKGKMSKIDYNEVCIQDAKPPSHFHKICKYFNLYEKKDLSMEEAILIPKNKPRGWYKNDSALKGQPAEISCFSNKAEFGWCKTCDIFAANNTPGFCDRHVLNDTNDKNVPIATVDSGWGFCSKSCHTGMIKADFTSKLDVHVLTESECAEIQKYYKGKKKFINTVLQLCAGVKLNIFPVYYYYQKIPGEKKYKFSKIPEGEEPENRKQKRLKEKEGYALPFHIGGKDSCHGDSGGPLWTMYENKKVLVGLVSSGTGCAEYNRPGIYCRIKYKLDWIYKYAKSGICKRFKRKKKNKKCNKKTKKKHSRKKRNHKKKRKKKKKKKKHY